MHPCHHALQLVGECVGHSAVQLLLVPNLLQVVMCRLSEFDGASMLRIHVYESAVPVECEVT
jgi:hypothetical protein